LYFEQFRVYRITAIDLFLFSKALSKPGIKARPNVGWVATAGQTKDRELLDRAHARSDHGLAGVAIK
jgi:hypothetical protein